MLTTRAPFRSFGLWRSCFLLCGALLALAGAQARSLDSSKSLVQYAHRTWGLEEGLFQPTIYSILQTKDGFLWLGTQDSLIRFDGVHFREFEYHGSPILHGALVRSLVEDKVGNLWAASIGSGLMKIAPDGSVTRFDAPAKLPSNNVFCLNTGRDGSLWACTDKGILRGSATTGFTVVNSVPTRDSCEAADGTRWIAGLADGLATTKLGSELSPVTGVQGPVNGLVCARDGSVWAGTASGVVHFRADRERETVTTHDGLPDNAVNSLLESEDGSLWIGTDDGISRWRQGNVSVYRTRDGLSHSVVLSLFADREGTLWAGTKDGLDQFTNPKLTPYTTAEGLSSNEAGPVLEDKSGRLWVGTLDAGLNVFEGRNFKHIALAQGLPSNRVLSLAVEKSGDVWAGTDRGLAQLREGRVAQVALRGEEVRSLLVDGAGTLWIGTGQNLYRRAGTTIKLVGAAPGGALILPGLHNAPMIVEADGLRLTLPQQAAWAYAATGVARPISCTYANQARDSVWIGTLGAGLVRWRGSSGTLARVHVKDGLYDNRIYGIVADGRSNLWIASSKGIFRVAEQELEDFADGKRRSVTSLPFTTGQLRFECRSGVQPAASRSADGRLWFATTTGVVVVDPDHLESNEIAPPVQMTSLIIDGERHAPAANVRMWPWQRNLEIRYAGLSFVSPEKVTFRYILDGYDKDWTDAGARREAFYTNLPPGSFRFRVIARNADGIWSREAASFTFAVEPRLYQRWWFYPALILLIAAIVFSFYKRRVQRIQKGFELVLAERGRIARELHDTLLQGLSGVTMQLQALWMRMPHSRDKQMLEEIIQDAAQCSTEARQSLWNLRTQPNGTRRFSDKLTALSHEMVGHTPLTLELKIKNVDLPEHPELEFQMLRIAREALSNVVRHAGASTVVVSLSAEADAIELAIADDGRGFPTDAPYDRAGHFGLLGMRERASAIGAKLELKSEPGRGSIVRLQVPGHEQFGELTKSREVPLHQLQ